MKAAMEPGAGKMNRLSKWQQLHGSQPAWLCKGTAGVWTHVYKWMFTIHSLLSLLRCDIHSISSKSNRLYAWLCSIYCVWVKRASSNQNKTFWSALQYNMQNDITAVATISMYPNLIHVWERLYSCVPPTITSSPFSHRIRVGLCTREGCICVHFCSYTVHLWQLLSASAPAGASKWIIHARFEYMQMVHSPLLAQIQVTYGNGTFKKHLFTPPPSHSPRHPPSDHVIHPVVLFRLLLYQAGWLHAVGWQDIP